MKSHVTLKLFKGQVRGKLFSLLLSWGLLLLIALTGCVSAVPEEAEPEQVESAAPVVEDVQVPSDDEAVSETTHLAENPELMAASRYEATRADERLTGSAFFAENPELMVADRYSAEQTMTDSDILAKNPELKVVRQYEAATEK